MVVVCVPFSGMGQAELPFLEVPAPHLPQEVIVAAEYAVWEKVPRELKKYVITPDEVVELVRS